MKKVFFLKFTFCIICIICINLSGSGHYLAILHESKTRFRESNFVVKIVISGGNQFSMQ